MNDPRIITRVKNQAECAEVGGARESIAEASIRITPPCAVENVKHVRPELGGHTLRNTGILYNPEVFIAVTGSPGVRQETG